MSRAYNRTEGGSNLGVRFGVIAAVQKEYISIKQLVEAMSVQVQDDAEKRPHRRVGEILVELGYMDQGQVEEVLGEIGADA